MNPERLETTLRADPPAPPLPKGFRRRLDRRLHALDPAGARPAASSWRAAAALAASILLVAGLASVLRHGAPPAPPRPGPAASSAHVGPTLDLEGPLRSEARRIMADARSLSRHIRWPALLPASSAPPPGGAVDG